MNELDILIDGIIAYGFLITGYACWLEVVGCKSLKPVSARTKKTRPSITVSVQQMPPIDKVA